MTLRLMADELSTQLAQTLSQWNQQPNGPQNAASALTQIADQTRDGRAEALAGWALGNTGNWPLAADYGRRAIEHGVISIASWMASNLQGQGDPSLRRLSLEFHTVAADAGVPVDFPGVALSFAQQSDLEGAADAISQLSLSRPVTVRAQWESLIGQVEPNVQSIAETAVKANAEYDRVIGEMNAERDAVQVEREQVERLAREVGELANKAAGAVLADNYGDRANRIERRANWMTITAIVLAVVIAGVALALAIDAGGESDPLDAALKKAPITIPFLLLNIYIARLASTFRDEAIKLRGIELQIRTASPFLGGLDPERRQAVLAMLALRFFPGQEVAGSGKAPSEPTDPGQAFAALLSQQAGLGGTSGTPAESRSAA